MGIQANASPLSPEELDGAQELAEQMVALEDIQPFKIFGGCCGTDETHMEALAQRLKEKL